MDKRLSLDTPSLELTLTDNDPARQAGAAMAPNDSSSKATIEGGAPAVDESAILKGKKLAVVFSAMLLSLLLIALE